MYTKTTSVFDFFPTTSNTLATYWNEQAKAAGSYPPYNIIQNADSTKFIVSLAVAGFSPEDLEVTVKENKLTVKGDAGGKELPEGFIYAHKGIAERTFIREFTLGEYVEVTDVSYEYGMLDIKLEVRLPEAKKPKKFTIHT